MLETSIQDKSNITQEVDEEDTTSLAVSIEETETSEKDWARIHYSQNDINNDSARVSNVPRYHFTLFI